MADTPAVDSIEREFSNNLNSCGGENRLIAFVGFTMLLAVRELREIRELLEEDD